MCVSHIRQARSLCTESSVAELLSFSGRFLFACESVGVGILSPSVETRMKARRMSSCRKLLKPVKHQVDANPSYFLRILSSQYKARPAESGGAGVPAGPTAPCCGNTSLWTSSRLQQRGFAARGNPFSSGSSGFPSCQCGCSAICLGTSHTVLSDSKAEGSTAEVFVRNGNSCLHGQRISKHCTNLL